jgi:hypothetical protein
MSDAPILQDVPAQLEVVAGDTWLGAVSVEADEIGPQPDDVAWGPFLDLVMHGSSPDALGHTALGDAVPAPGFSGAVDPRVARPGLLSSLGSQPPPVN